MNVTEVINAVQSYGGLFSPIATLIAQILIAVLGTLLAFSIWDYLNQPHLVPDEVVSKTVKQKKRSSTDQISHYVRIKNKGRVPATRCRAELRLRGETEYPEHITRDNQIIAVNLPLGWADMRGNLLVHQREDYSRNARIPAEETVITHLFRETSGYIMVADWVDPSGKPVLSLPADEYDIEDIGEKFGFNDDSNNLDVEEPRYQQSREIDYEKFNYIRWETAEIVVSAEEGSSFRQSLSIDLDRESNKLRVSLEK